MRKLLLASAAMLGGTMALVSVASAQGAPQSYTGGLFSLTGLQNPSAGSAGIAGLTPGAPGIGTSIPGEGTNPPLAPGNVTVRINGRINVYAGFAADSSRNPGMVTTANGGTPAAANTKVAPYGMFEYARLYPSMDAMAANGLKYGAGLEIRHDTGAAAGGGVSGNSVSGSVTTRGNLYFRREMAYMGTDNLGYIRFGATDQPTSLMLTGNFENFNDGGWNGDINLVLSNSQPLWPFEDVGALYTTTKMVYVSPKFFDMIDFGVSFEPGTGNMGAGPGCSWANSQATTANPAIGGNATACDATSSSSVVSENKRRRNTFDGVVRLRTAAGPVGIAATVGGMYGGSVQYNGTQVGEVQYNGLQVFDAGLQATYGGFAVGGHLIYGKDNGQWNLAPKGAPDEIAWLAGTSYAFGSFVVGTSFYKVSSAGQMGAATTATGTSQVYGVGLRSEYGIAAGGTLTLAPGAALFLSYLYGHRHQTGYDFVGGGTSISTNGVTAAGYSPVNTHNNVQSQALYVGTLFRW